MPVAALIVRYPAARKASANMSRSAWASITNRTDGVSKIRVAIHSVQAARYNGEFVLLMFRCAEGVRRPRVAKRLDEPGSPGPAEPPRLCGFSRQRVNASRRRAGQLLLILDLRVNLHPARFDAFFQRKRQPQHAVPM
jgi:hypothetical protein